VGQYLRPTRENISVAEYVTTSQFKRYERMAADMGFSSVACGPFVRSSYMAHRGFEELSQKPITRY
jgi:lipoic acid synthetase